MKKQGDRDLSLSHPLSPQSRVPGVCPCVDITAGVPGVCPCVDITAGVPGVCPCVDITVSPRHEQPNKYRVWINTWLRLPDLRLASVPLAGHTNRKIGI